jgi:hypothetical protein
MRSPRGFHVNGPGEGVGKRQLASLLSGSRTQAFPPATKATVCARALSPAGQPAGRRWPFANLVMTPDGEEPVPEPEVGGLSVDPPVQAASITRRPAVSREVAARIDLIGSPTLRRVIDPRRHTTTRRLVETRPPAAFTTNGPVTSRTFVFFPDRLPSERYVKSRSAAPGGAEWRRRQTSTKYPTGTAA